MEEDLMKNNQITILGKDSGYELHYGQEAISKLETKFKTLEAELKVKRGDDDKNIQETKEVLK